MKTAKSLSVCALVLLCSAAMLAQDPVKVDPTHYKVVFENASVRVLKIDYAAGAEERDASPSGLDRDSARDVEGPLRDAGRQVGGPRTAERVGHVRARGRHLPTNMGSGKIDGILVEFKTAAPGKATLPASRPGMAMKVLAEGPYGMAYRSTAEPTFQEAAGTKHDYDQVVIALGAAQMSLSIDGKPAKTTWARGDAVFVGRGVAHEAKNMGGKPVDFVIVAIK